MKRGTIIAALVLGVLCVVGPAIGAAPDGPGPWADYVVDFHQGPANNAAGNMTPPGTVLPERSDPTAALGPAESTGVPSDPPPPPGSFFSLGFGGSITLGFDNPICNAPGSDLAIESREVTFGAYPDERAQIYVSENGVDFVFAGTVTRDGFVSMPSGITVANFVRVVDVSDPTQFHDPFADGYDLDAVRAVSSSCPPGKLEICKSSANGAAYRSFQFSLNGGPPFSVKGGFCTGSITTQPGLNVIRELPSSPPMDVSGVSVRPSSYLISQDLANRTAKVKVVSGSTAASETRVTFTNEPAGGATGDLKICKTSDTRTFWGHLFSFRVNGGPLVSTEAAPRADPSLWSCRLVGTFKTGSIITVQEQIPAGTAVADITTDPPTNLTTKDLATGTLTMAITGGTNIAIFDDEAATPNQGGFIEICKDAARTGPNYTPDPGVTGQFTFTITPFGMPALPPVSTYVGQCTAAIPVPAGLVTVTEQAKPNIRVVDIWTDPDFALLGDNFINRTASIEVPVSTDPTQETQVHFVNAADSSQVKLCKALGLNSDALSGMTFTLRANGTPHSVVADKSGTQCVPAGNFPVGSSVTVTEDDPGANIVKSGEGTFTVQAGTANNFTITNTARGSIRICKNAVAGLTTQPTFRFRIDSGGYISVRAGGYCVSTAVNVSEHTVQEVLADDYDVTDIAVDPTANEVAGSKNLAMKSITVKVGFGQTTTVTYTNRIKRGTVVVCKAAGSTPPGRFDFDVYIQTGPVVAGHGQYAGSPYVVSAVPGGTCGSPPTDAPILQSDGSRTIIGVVEHNGPYTVTAITVSGDRGPCDLGPGTDCPYGPTGRQLEPAKTIDFYLGPGTNTVTYTNRAT